MRYLITITAVIFMLSACQSGAEKDQENKNKNFDELMGQMHQKSQSHAVKVLDSEDAGSYTYVKLEEGDREYWAAITARPVEIGKTYYYSQGMMMKGFESKQLNKTFDSVMFIQEFSGKPIVSQQEQPMNQQPEAHQHTKSKKNTGISVEAAPGGISIEELYSHKAKYDDQKVIIRGQVVKINKNIMKRNWIHIQDGSGYDGNYDLTVTTTQAANFQLGDIVTFEGTIDLNKDFGAGYQYDVIMENARVFKEKV